MQRDRLQRQPSSSATARLDEVVLAGTHNSMAASADGWLAARQTGGVGAQLAGGVRAFLLDLHYGVARAPVGCGPTCAASRTPSCWRN